MWCPKCKTEYREEIKTCVDCGVELSAEPPTAPALSPSPAPFDSWAKSTLSAAAESENLALVYTLMSPRRDWIHDILDDNEILYKVKIEPVKSSGRTFAEQTIFVESAHEATVLALIEEYEKSEIDLEDDDDVPQIDCGGCGEKIDFYHINCPLCGAEIN